MLVVVEGTFGGLHLDLNPWLFVEGTFGGLDLDWNPRLL